MHQENAIPKKQPEDITNRLGKSTTSLINMQVNGLCNFHIRGKFGDEKYKQINLWDGKERTAIDCKPIVGIEHSLNFPRRSIH